MIFETLPKLKAQPDTIASMLSEIENPRPEVCSENLAIIRDAKSTRPEFPEVREKSLHSVSGSGRD